MGYWQCPRCGSHEAFEGTEVVAGGNSGSVGITTEDGVSMSRSTGLQTKQVTVIKCKNCGEILNGERNYHYTPEELAQIQKHNHAREARKWTNIKFFGCFAVALGSCCITPHSIDYPIFSWVLII